MALAYEELQEVVRRYGRMLLSAKKLSSSGYLDAARSLSREAVQGFGAAISPYMPEDRTGSDFKKWRQAIKRFRNRLDQFFLDEWHGKGSYLREGFEPPKGVFAENGAEYGKGLVVDLTRSLKKAGVPDAVIVQDFFGEMICRGFALHAISEEFDEATLMAEAPSYHYFRSLDGEAYGMASFINQGWLCPWMNADGTLTPAPEGFLPDFMTVEQNAEVALASLRNWRRIERQLGDTFHVDSTRIYPILKTLLTRSGDVAEAKALAVDLMAIHCPSLLSMANNPHIPYAKDSASSVSSKLRELMSEGFLPSDDATFIGVSKCHSVGSSTRNRTLVSEMSEIGLPVSTERTFLEAFIRSKKSDFKLLEADGGRRELDFMKEGLDLWWEAMTSDAAMTPKTSAAALSLLVCCAEVNDKLFLKTMESYGHLIDLKNKSVLSPVIKRRIERIKRFREYGDGQADQIEASSLLVMEALSELGAKTKVTAKTAGSDAPAIAAFLEKADFSRTVTVSPQTPSPTRRRI